MKLSIDFTEDEINMVIAALEHQQYGQKAEAPEFDIELSISESALAKLCAAMIQPLLEKTQSQLSGMGITPEQLKSGVEKRKQDRVK